MPKAKPSFLNLLFSNSMQDVPPSDGIGGTGSDALDFASGGISATFFVPTDAAFEELGTAAAENAMKNRSLLKTASFFSFIRLGFLAFSSEKL
jgi:hypothetical protein